MWIITKPTSLKYPVLASARQFRHYGPWRHFLWHLNYFHILQNYDEEMISLIKLFCLNCLTGKMSDFKGKGKITHKKTDNLLEQTLLKRERFSKTKKKPK